jgi:hypothetical protein
MCESHTEGEEESRGSERFSLWLEPELPVKDMWDHGVCKAGDGKAGKAGLN